MILNGSECWQRMRLSSGFIAPGILPETRVEAMAGHHPAADGTNRAFRHRRQ